MNARPTKVRRNLPNIRVARSLGKESEAEDSSSDSSYFDGDKPVRRYSPTDLPNARGIWKSANADRQRQLEKASPENSLKRRHSVTSSREGSLGARQGSGRNVDRCSENKRLKVNFKTSIFDGTQAAGQGNLNLGSHGQTPCSSVTRTIISVPISPRQTVPRCAEKSLSPARKVPRSPVMVGKFRVLESDSDLRELLQERLSQLPEPRVRRSPSSPRSSLSLGSPLMSLARPSVLPARGVTTRDSSDENFPEAETTPSCASRSREAAIPTPMISSLSTESGQGPEPKIPNGEIEPRNYESSFSWRSRKTGSTGAAAELRTLASKMPLPVQESYSEDLPISHGQLRETKIVSADGTVFVLNRSKMAVNLPSPQFCGSMCPND